MFNSNSRDSITMKFVSIISAVVLVVGVFPLPTSAATATLFADGFDVNDYGAWTSGKPETGNWEVDSSGHTSKAARVKGNNNTSKTLYKTIAGGTTGYNNISISFWYKADETLSGNNEEDYVKLQWWNGVATTTLFTINHNNDKNANDNDGWHYVSISNISGANNINTFKIIFAADLDHATDKVLIDDVIVTGAEIDNTDPVISNVPANITDSTTDEDGKVVTFTNPSAIDNVDGSVSVTCVPPSGSNFAIGTTTVNCSTTDNSGNEASASFTVTINLIDACPNVLGHQEEGPCEDETCVEDGGLWEENDCVEDACENIENHQSQGPCADESCLSPDTWNVTSQHCDTPLDVCEGLPEMEVGPDCAEILCLAQVGWMWDEVEGCDNPIDTEAECLEDEGYWNGTSCEELLTECPDGQHVEDNDCVNDSAEQPTDQDLDGIEDSADNCPTIANEDQADSDTDGIGDVCDSENNNQNPTPETPASEPSAPAQERGGHINTICKNNMDDDNDGLYDENDPGCENDEDSSEENPVGGIGNAEVAGAACGPILNSYLGLRGKENDPEAVKIVQEFLNKELGLSLEVNGEYNAETIEAVKTFQAKYLLDVLTPWGIGDSTGIVYLTTQRMINMIACPGLDLPIPELK